MQRMPTITLPAMDTILCPVDFSLCSENAVKYAHDLAQLIRARLILCYSKAFVPKAVPVLSNSLAYTDSFPEQDEEEDVAYRLEELKNKLVFRYLKSAVTFELVQLEGKLKQAIPALLEKEKVDLIIIGHEAATEIVDQHPDEGVVSVIKNATCPVLIVPRHEIFKPLWKIVLVTNLQTEPAADCAFLLKIAQFFSAEIMLLHVLKHDVVSTRELANEALQKVYRKMPYRNISFAIEANELLEEGITKFAREHKADMVVLDSHPKKIWQKLVTGMLHLPQIYHPILPILVRPAAAKGKKKRSGNAVANGCHMQQCSQTFKT